MHIKSGRAVARDWK